MALYLLRTAATRRVAHLHTTAAARGADPATAGTLPTMTSGAATTAISACRKLMVRLQQLVRLGTPGTDGRAV